MTRSKINNSLENILISKRNKLNLKNNTLKDVNPLSILEKGFSLVYCNKKVANRISDFKLRDNLKIRMSDGELYSKVEDLKKRNMDRHESAARDSGEHANSRTHGVRPNRQHAASVTHAAPIGW